MVKRSLCVCFVDRCLSFCLSSFVLSVHQFTVWYLQILITAKLFTKLYVKSNLYNCRGGGILCYHVSISYIFDPSSLFNPIHIITCLYLIYLTHKAYLTQFICCWSSFAKPVKWAVMYKCAKGVDFVFYFHYDFPIAV